jgi:hypothetical protein
MKENDWAGKITTMRGKYMKKANQLCSPLKIQNLQVLVDQFSDCTVK